MNHNIIAEGAHWPHPKKGLRQTPADHETWQSAKVISGALLAASVLAGAVTGCAADDSAGAAQSAASAGSSLYVKVQTQQPR